MHSYLHGHPSLQNAVKRLERLNPDQFELYFHRKSSTRIETKNFEIESLTQAEDVGLSIRLIKDRRLGFSFTTSLLPQAIEKAVNTAFEVTGVMPQDENLGLHSFSTTVYPEVDAFDKTGRDHDLTMKIEKAKEMEKKCRNFDKRIQGVRTSTVTEAVNELQLVDSHGENIRFQFTMYTADISCKAESGQSAQMGQDFGFSNFLDTLDVGFVGESAAKRALELLEARSFSTTRCPVVMRNSVVAELLEFLGEGISAEQMNKGKSIFVGREGEKIFSEKVTLINHGLLPGGYSTRPFDGEGIPCGKTIVAENGFFINALYDNYFARKLGKRPTGSSSRNIKSPPRIQISNFYLENGSCDFNQLLDGISKGVFITELMGLHTANSVTGSFSLGASGIMIENGQLTCPVKGFAIAGNILELFRKTTDIGNDIRFFGNVGAPSIRISEISIGGT